MLNIVRAWILLSTWLVCAGWILSAIHQLNRVGYGVAIGVAAASLIFWQKRHPVWNGLSGHVAAAVKRRWRRPLPLLFLVMAVCVLVGGALYLPSNNDSNEYRIPRVWHWLSEGRWHWIHTLDERMNIAGTGFEWLSAPIMLFTRTDRIIFLINWVSYLMLPGLVFSVFTRLGVRPRVAWWWMWLLASGWCYVMQAGSTANDSFIVIYALASVDLALRAWEKNCATDLLLALLAAALVSGAKQTCIPLVALGAVAVWPSVRLLAARPVLTLLAGTAGILVSAVPMIFLNIQHTGSWVGVSPDSRWTQCALKSPFWGVIGNAFCIPEENLQPPYLPDVNAWNHAMERFLATPVGGHFREFERFGVMAQGASEADAGVGLLLFGLTIITICAVRRYRMSPAVPAQSTSGVHAMLLRVLPWGCLLVVMAKVGTYPIARQLAPYYVFLFPVFLVAVGNGTLVRRGWWQMLVLLTMLFTIGLLVVARNRPLFPAETILVPLKEKHPAWKFLSKAWDSYACRLSVEFQRHMLQNNIPPSETAIGYFTFRSSGEAALWVPFGKWQVRRILLGDLPGQLRDEKVHYVVLDSEGLKALSVTIGDWTNRYDGVLVDTAKYETQPGNTGWSYLVRLTPPAQAPVPGVTAGSTTPP